MWKTKFIFILIILLFGLIFQTSCFFSNKSLFAGNLYLPKADLIKASGPEVYVLENGVRRWIPNPEVFEHFRYKWTNVKRISDIALRAYIQGDDLDKYDDYPEGTLLKGSGPEVYLIELGKRRWIPNPAIFEGLDFGWKYIYDIDNDDLDDIKQGDNLTLSEANKYPDTIILKGPEQGEILETAEVDFKYSGTNPLGQASDLDFEVFLDGYDTRWRRQYSNYDKTYDLSEESKIYTFYVRAKNKQGYYDSSPASVSFRIGVSPYYQKVEIRRVYPKEDNFENDYLILRNKDKALINITGWTIKTKRETITVPQAIEKLRHPISSNIDSDIRLIYRDEVIISTGLSPQGVNFRTNKCTGYLDQYSQFHLSLDEDCPYASESECSYLSNACQDFIDDLHRCEIPDYSGDLDVSSDSECVDFLNEKFNYKQCYEDYKQDADFFGNEWRIFLSKSIDIFDNDGDTIVLRDENGLKVNEFKY